LASVVKKVAPSVAWTLCALTAACSAGTATDTMPTNADSARRLAQTVASNGACGSFEDYNFNRAKDTWVFTCQKQEMTFEIVAYGSEDARSAGIKTLNECCRTAYFAKNFYAVAIVGFGGDSADAALAQFRLR
jgi:hypothetical protein